MIKGVGMEFLEFFYEVEVIVWCVVLMIVDVDYL